MPLFFPAAGEAGGGPSLCPQKKRKRNEGAAKMKKTLDGRRFFV